VPDLDSGGLAGAVGPRPRRQRWADLRLRVLSAAVLAPLALACLWLGGWPWAALLAAAAIGLGSEWLLLCRRGAASLAAWVCGVPYVGLAVAALAWLRADAAAGRANVLFLVLIVWASDIGAYLVGRLAGGPRLAPSISPGKTWSGALGGLAAAVAVGWLAGAAFSRGPAEAPGAAALGVAALLGVAAQAGDLLESWIKRQFGVKDSGHLIPGHGGLFDRLDGVLAAAPLAAALALALGRGVVLWR
jgi:phosphatidate cytidylyltransferase